MSAFPLSSRHTVNVPLYRENGRPRQLRGYLAYLGLDGLMDRLADDISTERARHAFEASVPPHIHAACELLLFRDGELAIYVPEGAWASWLRNRQDRIVAALAEHRVKVARLRLVVTPGAATIPERPVARPTPPPPDAARLVRDAAASVTDRKLGNALERLARRLEASARDEP